MNGLPSGIPRLQPWEDVKDWQTIESVEGDDGRRRCGWCLQSPDYIDYHDNEWGRIVFDDVRIYEKLCLEGFQSGLSWLTILRKRENFRRAFSGFDPQRVCSFGEEDITRLMTDSSIVRHRGKIEATIANARATIEVQAKVGSLASLVWSFEPERKARMTPRFLGDLPSITPESTALSKALRRYGFRFIGPTTAYAAMQSLGMVNDHLHGCHVRTPCENDRRAALVPRP